MTEQIKVQILNAAPTLHAGMACSAVRCPDRGVFMVRITLWELDHTLYACKKHAWDLKLAAESNGLVA